MNDKKLSLRTEDVNLLRKIYETLTQKGRNLSEDKHYASGQGELKGKTEAYHFQLYKNEHFNGVQLRKLDELLIKIIKPRNKSVVEPQSGLELIERLPTEKATGIDRAKFIFECFAEAKGISQPECLLEILELCEANNLPLVAFENDRQGLKDTIENLRKYIAESQAQTHFDQQVTDELQENSNSTLIASNNIKIVTGEDKWLDPYNHEVIPLVGREDEIKLLDKFIEADERFLIWAISGPSGAGKTRLAIEWASKSELLKSENWSKRVLHKKDRNKNEVDQWFSTNPTLIIIDYMFGFEKLTSNLIDYCQNPTAPKIRLLILDHVFYEPLYSDKRWGFTGDARSFNDNEDFFFKTKPLDLKEKSNRDQEKIIRKIIAHRAKIKVEDDQIKEAHEYLKNTKGAYYPLFAALVGDTIKSGKDFKEWNRRQLIDYYLSGSDRSPWEHKDGITGELSTPGRWASYFIAVATARRAISYDDLTESTENFQTEPEHFNEVIAICQTVVTDNNPTVLKPFEPDILGENFFLKFLQFLRYSYSNQYSKEFRQIFMAGSEDTQIKDALEFIAFIQRLTRNLLNDDQKDKETQALWGALFNFMHPSDFESSEPLKWAVTVGILDILQTIQNQFSEKEVVALLNKIEASILYEVKNEGFLTESVSHLMLYIELMHKFIEIPSELSEKMFALFDRYSANSADGETPLMVACYYGFNNMIQPLIDHGADTEAILTGGGNALMVASVAGRTDTIRLLLDKKVNIEAIDNVGLTALMWASAKGHLDVVKLLLDRKANVDAANKEGSTALIQASIHNHTDTIRLLLDRKAKIDVADGMGYTALMFACGHRHVDMIKLLLNRKANTEARDNLGRTVLMLASSKDHLDTVKLLLDNEAILEAAYNDGQTALIMGCANGNINTVRLLLDRRANIKATDNYGHTALMWACQKNHIEVVKLLVKRKARIDVVDNEGQTALSIAIAKEHQEILQLLIEHSAVN